MTPIYAGIGARATPRAVLERMTTMAAWLARRGWYLRTGGAHGADDAFAGGAPRTRRVLFLPWPGYNGWNGDDCMCLPSDRLDALASIAAALHPAWDRCSPAVRKLHARNAAILLGPDAGRPVPVRAVVCWTEGGRARGGTGMAIRIAQAHGIPVLDMAVLEPRAVCERLEALRAGPARTPDSAPAATPQGDRAGGENTASRRDVQS